MRNIERKNCQNRKHIGTAGVPEADNPLNTPFFDHHEQSPIQRHAPPEGEFSRWLSVEEIRKMQRMRRATVIDAMNRGELPYEQRGRIRYARLSDVLLWEEKRLAGTYLPGVREIDPELLKFAE